MSLSSLRYLAFPVTFEEADVRRLCGPVAYREGDAWQRQGHVTGALLDAQGLHAAVAGSWRRVDETTISAAGSQLRAACTCGSGPFCRHAAALMLHWLRQPSSFAAVEEEQGQERPFEPMNPQEQLEVALLNRTMAELRALVRTREVKVTAKTKQELAAQLAELLSRPESVEGALVQLDARQRDALDVVDLLSAVGLLGKTYLARAWKGLRGEDAGLDEALAALTDRALLASVQLGGGAWRASMVPEVTQLHLPPRAFLSPLPSAPRVRPQPPHLLLDDVVRVIAHETASGVIGTSLPTLAESDQRYMLSDWVVTEQRATGSVSQRELRLVSLPPSLSQRDMAHLAKLTGQSPAMVDFTITFLLLLNILWFDEQQATLHVNHRELQAWQSLPAEERRIVLSQEWLESGVASDVGSIVTPKNRLQLWSRQTMYAREIPVPPGNAARRLVARVIGRLPLGWYSLEALLDLVWRLAPDLLSPNPPPWHFSSNGRPLKLRDRPDWELVWRPLLTAMLTGPLSWFGAVETTEVRGELAFQVLPGAALLVGRRLSGEPPAALPLSFTLGRDGVPVMTIPAALGEQDRYNVLADLGRLSSATPHGLVYRLPRESVQSAFAGGLTGPVLLEVLTKVAGGALPDDVRQVIEHWWQAFGRVRLYDDMTLIELGDDLLGRELQATSSLAQRQIHAFSPRLIAVDPADVEGLVTELTRLGYMPRVVEEA